MNCKNEFLYFQWCLHSSVTTRCRASLHVILECMVNISVGVAGSKARMHWTPAGARTSASSPFSFSSKDSSYTSGAVSYSSLSTLALSPTAPPTFSPLFVDKIGREFNLSEDQVRELHWLRKVQIYILDLFWILIYELYSWHFSKMVSLCLTSHVAFM